MTKKRIIYGLSAVSDADRKGAEFRNARHFTGIEENVSEVFIVDGSWPGVASAYKQAGVKVTVGLPGAESAPDPSAPPQKPADESDTKKK